LAWCKGRERFQLNVVNIMPRFLWDMYVECECDRKAILNEWVCRLVMGNAKTKSLMGKRVVYG